MAKPLLKSEMPVYQQPPAPPPPPPLSSPPPLQQHGGRLSGSRLSALPVGPPAWRGVFSGYRGLGG